MRVEIGERSGTQTFKGIAREYIEKSQDSIGKAAIILFSLFYIAGMISSNIFLMQYGVSDFSLLKPRYIGTGIITILPFLYSISITIAIIESTMIDVKFTDASRMKNVLKFLRQLLIAIIFWTTSSFFYTSFLSGSYFDVLWQGITLHFYGATATVAVALAVIVLVIEERGLSIFMRMTFFFMAIYGAWALLISFYAIFSANFLVNIPEQLGGMRPQTAVLLIDENYEEIERLGLPFEEGRPISKPLKLIFEGEEYYLVQAPSCNQHPISSPIKIRKDMIKAIKLSPIGAADYRNILDKFFADLLEEAKLLFLP